MTTGSKTRTEMSFSREFRQAALNAAALANAGRGLNPEQLIFQAERLVKYIEEGE